MITSFKNRAKVFKASLYSWSSLKCQSSPWNLFYFPIILNLLGLMQSTIFEMGPLWSKIATIKHSGVIAPHQCTSLCTDRLIDREIKTLYVAFSQKNHQQRQSCLQVSAMLFWDTFHSMSGEWGNKSCTATRVVIDQPYEPSSLRSVLHGIKRKSLKAQRI